MKKILLVFFISFIVWGTNISFWENSLCEWELWLPPCIGGEYNSNCVCIPDWTNPDWWANQWNGGSNPSDCPDGYGYTSWGINYCCPYPLEGWVCPTCPSNRIYTYNWQTLCCPGTVNNWVCENTLSDVWININTDCLLNGQCSLDVYKVVVWTTNENRTVLWLFQDITLASTTVALWTFVVVAMVLAWLYRAIASVSGKDTKKPKTIFISCFVWMLLVMSSYAVIRLIQFLATAWS